MASIGTAASKPAASAVDELEAEKEFMAAFERLLSSRGERALEVMRRVMLQTVPQHEGQRRAQMRGYASARGLYL